MKPEKKIKKKGQNGQQMKQLEKILKPTDYLEKQDL